MDDVTVTPQAGNGHGADYIFRAGTKIAGTLTIFGNIDATAQGTGSGGDITLSATSVLPFGVDSFGPVILNGVEGTLATDGQQAGDISIESTGGINIARLTDFSEVMLRSSTAPYTSPSSRKRGRQIIRVFFVSSSFSNAA